MTTYKGTLIPIGGNENKGVENDQEENFVTEGILAHVVEEAGGEDAMIVIIPTASSISVEVAEMYLEAFGKLNCTNLHILDIQTREQAETKEAISLVSKADCLMFSGGDQSKIAKYIGETTVHEIMRQRIRQDEGFVIAGTSAGAMMMSEEMIRGGSASEAMIKGNVLMGKGMGFVSSFIIDSHFLKRGRFGRLAEALAKFPQLMAVGLAEDTGLIIKNGTEFTVIGTGMVMILDGGKISHNNQALLQDGEAMSLSNLRMHILANGDKFNFVNKTIDILPLHAAFI